MHYLLLLFVSALVGLCWSQPPDQRRQPTYFLRNMDTSFRRSSSWFGLPRRRRLDSFGFTSPFGSSPFEILQRVRPRFVVWSNENMLPWSKWSVCRSRNCRRIRYRQCRSKKRCPADYLVETKKCTDALGCNPDDFITTIDNFNETCGERSTLQLKIIGGNEARPHSWPWQGGLLIKGIKQTTSAPECGATLIGEQWVLTAAHCLAVSYWPTRMPLDIPFTPERLSNKPLYVLLGDHNVGKRDDPEKIHKVEKVVVYKGFRLSPGTCLNDVALLKLKNPVKINKQINVACLPPINLALKPGTMCKALGWGVFKRAKQRTSFMDWFRPRRMIRSPVLQEVNLPLVSYDQCVSEYPAHTLTRHRHLCAGVPGKDTCKGDSGGPLMCEIKVANGQRRWFLYGITSFGSQHGCGSTYGVYTRVSAFVPWIRQMQQLILKN